MGLVTSLADPQVEEGDCRYMPRELLEVRLMAGSCFYLGGVWWLLIVLFNCRITPTCVRRMCFPWGSPSFKRYVCLLLCHLPTIKEYGSLSLSTTVVTKTMLLCSGW